MTSLTPDKVPMFNVGANQIHDSRGINTSQGERKLRASLLQIFNTGVDRNMDIQNQFSIAVSGGVETYENSKKTALLPGRVAVKIEREGSEEEKNAKYTYIFLNLNSLSKRLGIDKKTIKDAEANGSLDQLIVKRVQDLANEQAIIDNMLGDLAMRKDVFADKSTIPMMVYSAENKAWTEGKLTKKEIMRKFIEEHFSDDEQLMQGLEDFLAGMVTGYDRTYLKHLVAKLWWAPNAESLQHKDFLLEKVAVSAISTGPAPLFKFVYGTAAPRPDNKGTREVSRVTFFEWDTDKRYAIALEDDFAHTSEPTPRSGNEVALKLPNGLWVLVNKNSLKRLGIDKDTINIAIDTVNILSEEVKRKIDIINEASDLIQGIKDSFAAEKNNWMLDTHIIDLKELMTNYPDEMFKEITADFLNKFLIKEGQDREDYMQRGAEAKKAFIPIIEALEKNHLVGGRKEGKFIMPDIGDDRRKIQQTDDDTTSSDSED